MKKLELTMWLLLFTIVIFGQCPTEQSCVDYTVILNLDEVPGCLSGEVIQTGEDIDNNSDCEDANGDNCFKWIMYRSENSDIISVSATLGQGQSCNGEVDNIYMYADDCIEYGSSGSQNSFTFDFGVSDTLIVWICDGSSGEVSMCNLCVNYNPLPIELSYFKVRNKADNEILLEWETLQEINNDYFIVEQSNNLQDWKQIAKVEGENWYNATSNYSVTYYQSEVGSMYYRLSQVDVDGTKTIFDKMIRSARIDTEDDVRTAMRYGEWYNLVGRISERDERGLFLVRYKNRVYKIYR